MGMPSDFEQRLAFLRLGQEDLDLLAKLRPVLEERADELVAEFYRHLLSFAPTRQFLRDPAIRERLIEKQREYLLSLAGPKLDDSFEKERRRIGEAHERIGLKPRWYVGTYSLYIGLLTPIVFEVSKGDDALAQRTMIALHKLIILDLQLATEAYVDRRENDLASLNKELARAGRLLARDLDERRAELRDTVARAHAAEELAEIATLVAGLAHEIGTPMSVIQGHAKMLESEIHDDEASWRLRTIQEQIGRISSIIQALLNMARPGKSVRAPVELDALIENTLTFVTEKLGRHRIRVERELAPTPSVEGDSERLQQVFLNLLLNAADAMPDGGTLRVELCQRDGWVQVIVSDTGEGIPEADMERVFEPFFTSKPAGKGSGLGLPVTRGIIVDHGGTVEARNRPGKGAEFLVRLPAAGAASHDPGL